VKSVQKTNLRLSFEIEQFETAARRAGDDDRRADHRGRRRASADGAATFAMRRVEKDAALLQINCAVGRVERKNRVGSDAGNGVVGGDKFGARVRTRAHHVRHFENVVDRGAVARLIRCGDDFHIVDDLRKFRLLQINRLTD